MDEYTEIKLNNTEASLPPDEMAVVAGQKQLIKSFVMGEDKDGLKKALKLEHVLTEKRAKTRETEQHKNGRSKR